MLRRYFERLDRQPSVTYRRIFLVFAIFFAMYVGMQLEDYRYGHGDSSRVIGAAAMLLMVGSFLVSHRWLRLFCLLGSLIAYVIFLSLLTRGLWHTRI